MHLDIVASGRRPVSEAPGKGRPALLWSGGIGDYLHYIVRLSPFLRDCGVAPRDLTLFVESTSPPQVSGFLRRCIPELEIRFVPRAIHWTKTNPLLDVDEPIHRRCRPASQFVAQEGFCILEDWFLPFLCRDRGVDLERLAWLTPRAGAGSPDLVIAARDKGFLWFPSEETSRGVTEVLPDGARVVHVGTPDERLPWIEELFTASSVEEALLFACGARLLVGTDTGMATAREMLGLPNIYCMNEYWFHELMSAYGYWPEWLRTRSTSTFAFGPEALYEHVARRFSRERDVEP
jgi:hypothetical protein